MPSVQNELWAERVFGALIGIVSDRRKGNRLSMPFDCRKELASLILDESMMIGAIQAAVGATEYGNVVFTTLEWLRAEYEKRVDRNSDGRVTGVKKLVS